MRTLLVSLTFLLFFLAPTTLVDAQTLAGGALKSNLDLPFDAGLLNDDAEDEDAPELITFYSQQYEGDGIFYCIDHSSSMRFSDLDCRGRKFSCRRVA
jgi:hypothetical protein